jgi:hypothetical protein
MASTRLPKKRFQSVLQTIANGLPGSPELKTLRTATYARLRELGVERDLSRARPVPADENRETCEVDAVIRWVGRIGKRDRRALGQLIVVDATVVKRRE